MRNRAGQNAHSFRDNLTHFFWYAKVRSKEDCVSSFIFELRFNQAAVLFISSHKDNFSASSRDAMNRGLSDSRCSTRDECNATCQIHSVTSCYDLKIRAMTLGTRLVKKRRRIQIAEPMTWGD